MSELSHLLVVVRGENMAKKKRLLVRTSILVVLGVVLFITLYQNLVNDVEKQVSVGEIAPDFELTTLSGETVSLSDFRGQGVFLNFWATYCEPCKQEMPAMDYHYKQYEDEGVVVLAVNVNETKIRVKDFADAYGVSFPLLLDNGEVYNAYGVGPIPSTFLINKNGKVVEHYEGQRTSEQIEMDMERIKP